MHLQKLILWLAGVFFLTGCQEKKQSDLSPAPEVPPTERSVYVVCEGNMGSGNSALTLYLPDRDSVYEDVFYMANQKELGDVFLSMTVFADDYWLCINNSDKIVILDGGDWKLKTEISVSKPRYLVRTDEQTGYLSSIFSNQLYRVDFSGRAISGSIQLPARNPEGMLLHQGVLYVCAWDTTNKELFALDPGSGQIIRRFQLEGYAPQDVVADKNGRLWVFSGDAVGGKAAYISQIDPRSGNLLKSFRFSGTGDLIRPTWNKTQDTLYFIAVDYDNKSVKNGVYRMSIDADKIPDQPFIGTNKYQYFWALGIEPATGLIYVGDPRGFIQKGLVFIYRPDGSLVGQFTTGAGPGHFYFPE